MTFNDFRSANRNAQIEAIVDKGVRLLSRDVLEFTVILYQIEYFYVEVFYDKEEGSFSVIRCFKSTTLLDPYLENMDIHALLPRL